MIALIDCNNFYVSCERVFNPSILNKPVVVLSNNSGCIISRSAEVKAIGIKMGVPLFEAKPLIDKYNVYYCSSNYTLYADMSNRFHNILQQFGIRQERYSIDESFLDLSGIPNLTEHGHKIRNKVNQWVNLPVCVGIGQTKVLAKFANYLAKKYSGFNGVCNLVELGENRVNKAMSMTPVSEVWGIGRKIGYKLQYMGIKTILDLKTANPKQLRNLFNVNIEKIISELNGIPCIALEDNVEPNKRVVSSRSFGRDIYDYDSLLSSINYHIEQGSRKLRKQGLYARQLTIFICTNRFKEEYYSHSRTIVLPQAIDSFRYLASYIQKTLKDLYIPGLAYKKSGIILSELITSELECRDLFDEINIKSDPIISAIELIRRKFGKSAINLASTKLSNKWFMKEINLSRKFTTEFNEIAIVK